MRVPPLGLKRPYNRNIVSGECVKVNIDISSIHVVVAESCCKRRNLTNPTKIWNIMMKVNGQFEESW